MLHTLVFLQTEESSYNFIDTERIVEDYKKGANVEEVYVKTISIKPPIMISDLYNIIAKLKKEHGLNFLVIDDDSRIVPKVRGADMRSNHISIYMELKKIVEHTDIPIYVCTSRTV